MLNGIEDGQLLLEKNTGLEMADTFQFTTSFPKFVESHSSSVDFKSRNDLTIEVDHLIATNK